MKYELNEEIYREKLLETLRNIILYNTKSPSFYKKLNEM